MPISVNTHMASLTAQNSLNTASKKMNTAMERLSTGYKINSSKDDAAGMAVSTKLGYKLSCLAVAKDNGQMGSSLLNTTEGVYGVLQSNLQRVRDLTEQAANGTYGSDSMLAITSEVQARLEEISRLANSTEFNGQYLLNGSIDHAINLQLGITSSKDSVIELPEDLFAKATTTALFTTKTFANISELVKDSYKDDTTARAFLNDIDKAMEKVTNRITTTGGIQQRIIAATESITVMSDSMTSAVGLIQDADIAAESTKYIKNQILQQTSTAMLSSANQIPALALSLLG